MPSPLRKLISLYGRSPFADLGHMRACVLLFLVFSTSILYTPGCGDAVAPAAHIRFHLKETGASAGASPEFGYLAVDPATRAVIAEHNPRDGFIPASVSKIPTALAALAVLGPNHRFETRLASTGTLVGGTLEGDLYLVGGGDPGLLIKDVADLADVLARRGIRRIKGRFFVDDSALPRRDIISESMGGDAAYNPALSALSLEYNMMHARWIEKTIAYPSLEAPAPRTRGRRKPKSYALSDYRLMLTPDLPIHRLQSTSSPSPDKIGEFEYQLHDNRDTWLFQTDFIKRNRGRGMKYLPVRRPAVYTGSVLQKLAAMRGLVLPDPEEGTLPLGHILLHVHQGRPLAELSESTLQWSNNLMADLLLLSTAKKLVGKPVPLEEAGKTVAAFWKRTLPGVEWKSFVFENGSGLTGKNRISPEQMVAMLAWAEEQDFGGRRFVNSLPVTGWSGSLRGRLRYPETNFRVQAKTGTIFYGVALAGEYYDHLNRRRLFVQFYHDPARRDILDDPKDPRFRAMRRAAYSWVRASREALDRRLLRWVLRPKDPLEKAAAAVAR